MWIKTTKTCKPDFGQGKNAKHSQKYICNRVWKSLNNWAAQNNYIKKTLRPKMIHCCEAPRSMLSSYFCKKQVLRGNFGKIWCIQIKMYPKTYVELKYGACYLKNKVSANRLELVVQLSWRVATPYKYKIYLIKIHLFLDSDGFHYR